MLHKEHIEREVLNNSENKDILQGAKNEREIKERIFLTVIFDELLDAFEDDLYNAGAEEEDVTYFRQKVSSRSQEEILGILSLPKDIRVTLFAKAFKENDSGNKAVDQILSVALTGYRDFGFTLGYHVSQKDIEPGRDGWMIHGTEFDDRDEMKMAYYSVDYNHFYRKKPGKWIYFVRAEMGNKTAHKLDNDNRWSRAPLLSIVDRVLLHEVDDLVNALTKEAMKKRRPSDSLSETAQATA
jgi:hypothetical protein